MKRKSTAQKIIEGDRRQRGRHKLDEQLEREPKTMRGLPRVSPRLRGDAALIWSHLREQLEVSGMDSAIDTFNLEAACKSLAAVWQADAHLAREPLVRRIPILNGRGNARRKISYRQVTNKWATVRREALRQYIALCDRLGVGGMVTRSGLTIEPDTQQSHDSLWAKLLAPRPKKNVDPAPTDAPPN